MKIKTDVTVNSRKFDGKIHKSWNAELLKAEDSHLILLGVFENEIIHQDLGVIRPGTISFEYYWLDKWFNIFCFYEANGAFRNFYCNLNMPPTFKNNVLDYVDLDIDILVENDSSYKVLDRLEFEQNAQFYQYPKEIILQTEIALIELLEKIKQKTFPFSEICKMPTTD